MGNVWRNLLERLPIKRWKWHLWIQWLFIQDSHILLSKSLCKWTKMTLEIFEKYQNHVKIALTIRIFYGIKLWRIKIALWIESVNIVIVGFNPVFCCETEGLVRAFEISTTNIFCWVQLNDHDLMNCRTINILLYFTFYTQFQLSAEWLSLHWVSAFAWCNTQLSSICFDFCLF